MQSYSNKDVKKKKKKYMLQKVRDRANFTIYYATAPSLQVPSTVSRA